VRSDLTAECFDELASRGHEPLLRKVTGSARFDVVAGQRTEHWLVTIDKGDIRVSRVGTLPLAPCCAPTRRRSTGLSPAS
jgi:hypothetical protein